METIGTKRMHSKLVAFDSSYIRSNHSKIEENYPNKDYIYCLCETIDLEFNDSKTGQGKIYTFLAKKAMNFNMLLPRGQIFLEEVYSYINNTHLPIEFPLCSNEIQQQRCELFETKNQDAISKLKSRIQEMSQSENYYWKRIAIGKDIALNREDFIGSVNKYAGNYPIYIEHGFDISALYDANNEDFIKNCPSCYYYLLLLAFLKQIKKSPDVKNQFTMTLDNISVQFKKSFITDLLIILPFIPYVDKFATCDKPQAEMLKFILEAADRNKIIIHENKDT